MSVPVPAVSGVTRPTRRRRLRVLVLGLAVVVVAWLTLGGLRAQVVARDYFTGAHGAGTTVVDVSVLNVRPGIGPWGLPVWSVEVTGDVIEPGAGSGHFTSALWLNVEPVTGAVFVRASG
jgi:hypothetical protein